VTVDHHFKDPTPKFKQGQGQPEVQIVNNLHIHNIKPNMSYTQWHSSFVELVFDNKIFYTLLVLWKELLSLKIFIDNCQLAFTHTLYEFIRPRLIIVGTYT
jgi:hypothetical protein